MDALTRQEYMDWCIKLRCLYHVQNDDLVIVGFNANGDVIEFVGKDKMFGRSNKKKEPVIEEKTMTFLELEQTLKNSRE